METKVVFNKGQVKRRIIADTAKAQKRLDAQVMKDANYFCPKDSGDLQRSVLGSTIGSGILTWAISYAKKIYNWKGRVRKETNPNASVKWFEVAKSRYKDKWVKVAQNGFGK